jgi:polyhydroxybutyrate depolymerase
MPFKDGEINKFTLSWQGRPREYSLFRPGAASPDAVLPLVIMLHGGGSSAEMVLKKYDWTDRACAQRFLLALPDACVPFPGKPASFRHNPRAWNDGSGYGYAAEQGVDDSGFIGSMLDEISRNFKIDASRIYISGFSNGASMAMRAGIELSGRIAAVGPVSGHLWLEKAVLRRPVPMIYIIGGNDPVNPLEGGYSVLPWGKKILKQPVAQTIEKWLSLSGCEKTSRLISHDDGVKVTRYGSGDCEVLYYEVEGLGHVWPGGVEELPRNLTGPRSDKLNASAVIWEFFKAHPLKPV